MTKTNQKPQPKKRELIAATVPTGIRLQLNDTTLTTAIHRLWPDLERLLLSIQRHTVAVATPETAGHVVKAVDEIINTLQLFSEQGRLDLQMFHTKPE